jgi:hypothetical protein
MDTKLIFLKYLNIFHYRVILYIKGHDFMENGTLSSAFLQIGKQCSNIEYKKYIHKFRIQDG